MSRSTCGLVAAVLVLLSGSLSYGQSAQEMLRACWTSAQLRWRTTRWQMRFPASEAVIARTMLRRESGHAWSRILDGIGRGGVAGPLEPISCGSAFRDRDCS